MEPRPPQPEHESQGPREPEALEPSAPLRRALASLHPVSAPVALDERVALECATEAPVASWLRALPAAEAPAVLDRLVLEELSDPQRALAERFVGDLFGQGAPLSLRGRLVNALNSEGGRQRRAQWSLVGAGLAAAAMALLVFWPQGPTRSNVPSGGDLAGGDLAGGEVRARLRLKRVTVASADRLSPMAALLSDSLAGGLGLSAQRLPLTADEFLGEAR